MSDAQEKLPEWMLKLENKRKKQHRLAHEIGAGAPCFVCGDDCPGLDLHFWRKLCRNCKCKKEDHDVKDDEGYEQFEILLGSGRKKKKGGFLKIKVPDEKCPVAPRENSSKGVSFEWLPPNVSEEVAAEYMKQLPASKLPISGSDGALYRRQQLTKQMPLHDLDARHCDNLTPEEIEQLMKYLENLKSNVVGQGFVSKVPVLHPGSQTAISGAVHLLPVDQSRPLVTSQSADAIRPLPPMPPAYNSMPRPFHTSASASTSSSAYGSGEDDDLPPPLPTSLPPRTDLKTPSEFIPDWRLPDDFVFKKVMEGMQDIQVNQQEISGSTIDTIFEKPKQYTNDFPQPPNSGTRYSQTTPAGTAFSQTLDKGNSFSASVLGHKTSGNRFGLPFSGQADSSGLQFSNTGKLDQCAPGAHDLKREVISGTRLPTGVALNITSTNGDSVVPFPADATQVSSITSRGVANSSAVDKHGVPMTSDPLSNWKNLDRNSGSLNPAFGTRVGIHPTGSLSSTLTPGAMSQSEIVSGVRGIAEPLRQKSGGNISDVISGSPGQCAEEARNQINSHPVGVDFGKQTLPQSANLQYGMPDSDQQTVTPTLPVDGVKTLNVIPHTLVQSSSVGTDALPKSAEVMQQHRPSSLDPTCITATPGSTGLLPAETPGGSTPHLDCRECGLKLLAGDVAVFAERAGSAAWHPGCFVCSTCKELLVDLMYFYHKSNVYCGRHFADLLGIPRCFACDELIFVSEYTMAEGKAFHVKHFCCYECDDPLGGKRYIPVDDQPVCLDCYERKYGKKCHTCKNKIAAGEQRVGWKHLNWHVQGNCFRCFECAKSLLGGRFVVKEDQPFCSKECVQVGLQKMAGAA